MPVKTQVNTGRFALERLAVIRKADREIVITPRTKRPGWAPKFFGSRADRLAAPAGR